MNRWIFQITGRETEFIQSTAVLRWSGFFVQANPREDCLSMSVCLFFPDVVDKPQHDSSRNSIGNMVPGRAETDKRVTEKFGAAEIYKTSR